MESRRGQRWDQICFHTAPSLSRLVCVMVCFRLASKGLLSLRVTLNKKNKKTKKAERLGKASQVKAKKSINICTNKEKESENMHRELSRTSQIF